MFEDLLGFARGQVSWLTERLDAWSAAALGLALALVVVALVRRRRNARELRTGTLNVSGAMKSPRRTRRLGRGLDLGVGDVRRMALGGQAAVFAAVLATALAYEAIHRFVVDVVGLPSLIAVALAGFLEAAAIASALLARDAIRDANRPAGVDLVATWVFASASATIAALNELITLDGWDLSPRALLAALFRTAPALVACWLWGRSLHADRVHAAGGLTLRERRRARRIHAVAMAELKVLRLREAGRPTFRAQARVDRRRAALRLHYPSKYDLEISADLELALTEYGAVGPVDPVGTPMVPASGPGGFHGWVADWASRWWVPTVVVVGVVVVAAMLALPTGAAVALSMGVLVSAVVLAWRSMGTRGTEPGPVPHRPGHDDSAVGILAPMVGDEMACDDASTEAASTPMVTAPDPTGSEGQPTVGADGRSVGVRTMATPMPSEPRTSGGATPSMPMPMELPMGTIETTMSHGQDAAAIVGAHGIGPKLPWAEGTTAIRLDVRRVVEAALVIGEASRPGAPMPLPDVATALGMAPGTCRRYRAAALRILEETGWSTRADDIARGIAAITGEAPAPESSTAA